MYNYERPDLPLLTDLERLLRHVAEELGAWRRRCLKAESELESLREGTNPRTGPDLVQARQRVVELEVENRELRERIDAARTRVQAIGDRLVFLGDREDGAA
ncbi:MAG: hypothetical protein ACREL6_04805 [Gemmatimonadales bacterium]